MIQYLAKADMSDKVSLRCYQDQLTSVREDCSEVKEEEAQVVLHFGVKESVNKILKHVKAGQIVKCLISSVKNFGVSKRFQTMAVLQSLILSKDEESNSGMMWTQQVLGRQLETNESSINGATLWIDGDSGEAWVPFQVLSSEDAHS